MTVDQEIALAIASFLLGTLYQDWKIKRILAALAEKRLAEKQRVD